MPAKFVALCEDVVFNTDPNRFGLLWRMVHEPGLRNDPLDPDRLKPEPMPQAASRDVHEMKEFVRFKSVKKNAFRTHPEGGPLQAAWFEPGRTSLKRWRPFFAQRFTQMR